MTQVRVYAFKGLGNDDTSPGISSFARTANTIIGVTASAHDWEHFNEVIMDIGKLPVLTKRFVLGYSNGVWSASKVALAKPLDCVFALDGSIWLPPAPLPSTVKAAASVYAVLGSNFDLVGHDALTLAPSNNKTKLTVVKRWGVSHEQMQFDPWNVKTALDTVRAMAA